MKQLRCTRCDRRKGLDDFYTRSDRLGGSRFGRQSWCKKCMAEQGRVLRQTKEGREQANKRVAKYRQRLRMNNPALLRQKERDSNLKRLYGISLETYEAMAQAQGGRCAICSRKPNRGRGLKMHVDHDHETGEIRGLLCEGCNIGLGKFKDDHELMIRAAQYLKRHKCIISLYAS